MQEYGFVSKTKVVVREISDKELTSLSLEDLISATFKGEISFKFQDLTPFATVTEQNVDFMISMMGDSVSSSTSD